jgi:hypothetical protein
MYRESRCRFRIKQQVEVAECLLVSAPFLYLCIILCINAASSAKSVGLGFWGEGAGGTARKSTGGRIPPPPAEQPAAGRQKVRCYILTRPTPTDSVIQRKAAVSPWHCGSEGN